MFGCDRNHALARYAALYQEAGLVPIVKPEVLMDGGHTLARCRDVTEAVVSGVLDQLHRQPVLLEGMLLKFGLVLPGLNRPEQASVDEVADATVISLPRVVPMAVPEIVFLSGGQSSALATARSNAMNVRFRPPEAQLPWTRVFSCAQAMQHPALVIWQGQEGSRVQAQQALYDRAKLKYAACQGQCDASMEAA